MLKSGRTIIEIADMTAFASRTRSHMYFAEDRVHPEPTFASTLVRTEHPCAEEGPLLQGTSVGGSFRMSGSN